MKPALYLLIMTAAPAMAQDSRHIPMGSPLGEMPILISPHAIGFSTRPLISDEAWERAQRAAVARARARPEMRALERRMAELDREANLATAKGPGRGNP
ncbi:hypothetical protein [Sphingomonas bacterium]|uniref:hypothetical protein n=1 Tax=Sphingomonas bacterium TaxID=1895847 RepID=UPI001575762D|nr:hypothetical protein [Sphingomonas bacterium]